MQDQSEIIQMSEVRHLVDRKTGTPVPLKGVLFDITVQHTVAEFRMHQFYENQEESAIETEFLFPLDPQAALTEVKLDFEEGKCVEAQLFQLQKGKKKYSDAMASGKSAALAGYSASDKGIMKIALGNFPPKYKAQLTVIWHKKLEIQDLSWCLRLPTTFTPRYQGNIPLFLKTGKALKGEHQVTGQSIQERLEKVREFREQSFVNKDELGYWWNLTLRIEAGSHIARLTSPSHPLIHKFSKDGKSVNIEIDHSALQALGQKCLPDRTFTLFFRDESLEKPQVILQQEQECMNALFSFFPQFIDPQVKKAKRQLLEKRLKQDTNCDFDGNLRYEKIMEGEGPQSQEQKKLDDENLEMPGEFIFLIDRSGSMSGERIVLARQSLLLFLASIPPGSRFNIYSFGSNYSALFKDRSAIYNEENYKAAKSAVSSFEADMGGTEVYQACKNILSLPSEASLPRHVFLLTDGAVSNPQSIIKLVQQNKQRAKFHTFGIGNGASEELVKGVAQSGRGNYYFVNDNEGSTLQSKVIDALCKTSSPSLGNIELQFQDKESVIEVVPNQENFPILQDRQPFVVFARLKKDFHENSNIKLKYENLLTHQKFEHIMTLTKSSLDKTNSHSIIKLMAKSKLAALERNKEKKEECIALSLKYGVLSQFTVFLAVQRLVDSITGEVEYRRVPVFHNKPSGQMFFKTLTGKTITGGTDSIETVLDMKKMIQDKEGIPVDQIRLVSAGREVQNDEEIDNFENEQTFHMVLRLRGTNALPKKEEKKQCQKEDEEKRRKEEKQLEERERQREEEERAMREKLTLVKDLIQDKTFYVDLQQGKLTIKETVAKLTADFKGKFLRPSIWLNSKQLTDMHKTLGKLGLTQDSQLEFSYITLEGIISLQKFDGSWSLNTLIQAKLIEKESAYELLKKLDQEESVKDLAYGTAWAVKIITEEFAEEGSSWKLLVTKAKNFLNKQGQNYETISKLF